MRRRCHQPALTRALAIATGLATSASHADVCAVAGGAAGAACDPKAADLAVLLQAAKGPVSVMPAPVADNGDAQQAWERTAFPSVALHEVETSGRRRLSGEALRNLAGLLCVVAGSLLALLLCARLSSQDQRLKQRLWMGEGDVRMQERDRCRNMRLYADVYGFAVSSLVRDVPMQAEMNGGDASTLRFCKLALSMGLLFGNIALQFFVMVQVQTFCTSRSVHDIRESYDEFEFLMYGSNESHMTMAFHGNRRGARGIEEFFQPELFDGLSEDLKVEVCSIPLSQPHFFLVAIFIWTLACVSEMKKIMDMAVSLMLATPTQGSMRGALARRSGADGNDLMEDQVIVHLTLSVKIFMFGGVILPRLVMTWYALYLGCRWLVATNDFTEMLLNCIILIFVLLLKDLLYHSLVPEPSKKDLEHTEMKPVTEIEFASYWAFLGAFLWAGAAAGWCLLYTYKLQRVLPDYRWDVRDVCAQWLAESSRI